MAAARYMIHQPERDKRIILSIRDSINKQANWTHWLLGTVLHDERMRVISGWKNSLIIECLLQFQTRTRLSAHFFIEFFPNCRCRYRKLCPTQCIFRFSWDCKCINGPPIVVNDPKRGLHVPLVVARLQARSPAMRDALNNASVSS